MRQTLTLLAGAAWLLLAGVAAAAPLAAPEGPVVLRVTGDIANANAGDAAEFDLAMLESLASRVTETETPWYDAERAFSGPLVSAIMAAAGANGSRIRVFAINDYAAEIPLADATDYPLILATRIDGETMSIRDKGPLFVIYPFDAFPELENELHFGRSVWQVNRIDVY